MLDGRHLRHDRWRAPAHRRGHRGRRPGRLRRGRHPHPQHAGRPDAHLARLPQPARGCPQGDAPHGPRAERHARASGPHPRVAIRAPLDPAGRPAARRPRRRRAPSRVVAGAGARARSVRLGPRGRAPPVALPAGDDTRARPPPRLPRCRRVRGARAVPLQLGGSRGDGGLLPLRGGRLRRRSERPGPRPDQPHHGRADRVCRAQLAGRPPVPRVLRPAGRPIRSQGHPARDPSISTVPRARVPGSVRRGRCSPGHLPHRDRDRVPAARRGDPADRTQPGGGRAPFHHQRLRAPGLPRRRGRAPCPPDSAVSRDAPQAPGRGWPRQRAGRRASEPRRHPRSRARAPIAAGGPERLGPDNERRDGDDGLRDLQPGGRQRLVRTRAGDPRSDRHGAPLVPCAGRYDRARPRRRVPLGRGRLRRRRRPGPDL